MLYWQEDLNSKRERFIFCQVKKLGVFDCDEEWVRLNEGSLLPAENYTHNAAIIPLLGPTDRNRRTHHPELLPLHWPSPPSFPQGQKIFFRPRRTPLPHDDHPLKKSKKQEMLRPPSPQAISVLPGQFNPFELSEYLKVRPPAFFWRTPPFAFQDNVNPVHRKEDLGLYQPKSQPKTGEHQGGAHYFWESDKTGYVYAKGREFSGNQIGQLEKGQNKQISTYSQLQFPHQQQHNDQTGRAHRQILQTLNKHIKTNQRRFRAGTNVFPSAWMQPRIFLLPVVLQLLLLLPGGLPLAAHPVPPATVVVGSKKVEGADLQPTLIHFLVITDYNECFSSLDLSIIEESLLFINILDL